MIKHRYTAKRITCCGVPRENVRVILVSLPNDGLAPVLQAEIDGVPHHAFPGTNPGDWAPRIWFECAHRQAYEFRGDIEKWGL